MTDYEPFPISNFRINLDESQEPWLLPREAFQSVTNAHVYRGVLEKINGYILYAVMSYRSIIRLTGSGKVYTGTLTSAPTTTNFFGIGEIVEGSTAETFTYLSDGTFPIINLQGSAGGTGTVNLTTLLVTLNFNSAPPVTTYSGVIFIWDRAPIGQTSIMGIKQYYAQNGTQQILIFDEKRVGKIVNTTGIIQATLGQGAPYGISELPHQYYQAAVFTGDGTTQTFTSGVNATAIAKAPMVPGTVNFYGFSGTTPFPLLETVTDTAQGGLVESGTTTTGSINYSTGAYTITFQTAPVLGEVFDVSVGFFGDIFTGDFTNFISITNFLNSAFFTNNLDPIYYYDGTLVHYLNTSTSHKLVTATLGVPNNFDIITCLHVFTYRFALLLIAPQLLTKPELYTIYWSVFGDPFDFTNDDFLIAPTSERIRAIGQINNDLIVRFARSERIFRYTGDAFAPFRWDTTNSTWRCEASYSAINYDTYVSSVGKPGIVGSDGVNAKRIDERIPDFTDSDRIAEQTPLAFLNQSSIHVCYGERFDDLKEGWLCYNSVQVPGSVPSKSDNVLAFNYMDESWGIYSFPFSCTGFGQIIDTPTWGNTYTQWQNMQVTWDSFELEENALIDLGGDHFDRVWQLNSGSQQTDVAGDALDVMIDVYTKNFNPYIEEGQLSRLGYVDFFVSSDANTFVRVQFYIDDQLYFDANGTAQGFYQETILNFKPTSSANPNNQTKIWKRVYVGSVGKEHTFRIYQNPLDMLITNDQPVRIHAIVPYFKPAGRIFN